MLICAINRTINGFKIKMKIIIKQQASAYLKKKIMEFGALLSIYVHVEYNTLRFDEGISINQGDRAFYVKSHFRKCIFRCWYFQKPSLRDQGIVLPFVPIKGIIILSLKIFNEDNPFSLASWVFISQKHNILSTNSSR